MSSSLSPTSVPTAKAEDQPQNPLFPWNSSGNSKLRKFGIIPEIFSNLFLRAASSLEFCYYEILLQDMRAENFSFTSLCSPDAVLPELDVYLKTTIIEVHNSYAHICQFLQNRATVKCLRFAI